MKLTGELYKGREKGGKHDIILENENYEELTKNEVLSEEEVVTEEPQNHKNSTI